MKSKLKRMLILSVLLTVLFILGTTTAFAKEKAIPSIYIEAILQSDGSAVITETWNVRGVSGGTEYYKAFNNMEGMSVHSLQVRDESGTQYKTLDYWDTKLSREEKAGTCGILKTSDGYELCWGIGSYGDHEYTIQYVLEGLVKDYGDYAGFYHQFVSELSSAPEAVSIIIQVADTSLSENNARIWGYGFPGNVEITGGGILTAISSKAFDSGDYVNVLCRFDRGLFPLASTAEMSFENLQKSAENENSNTALFVFLIVFAAAIIVAIFLINFFSSRYKLVDGTTVRLVRRKQLETTWSIPFGGSIPAVYAAMNLFRKGISADKLMGAYLIRWQKAGYISIKEQGKEEVIVFSPEKKTAQGVEQSLYNILISGADQDGILWSSDIEKRAEKLFKMLNAWAKDLKTEGEHELIRWNAAATDRNGVVRFTATGFDQAVQMLGFQKYLMEMTRRREDEAAPRELWEDYLVFASLFSIGEQVLKSMEALDPTYFKTFSGIYGYNSYSMMHFMIMTNHISNTAASNINGTGGPTTSVGGGGFSGGGGGGSR